MTQPLLEIFRKAYRDLDLFPLLSAEQIAAFRVDYGEDTLARLEQAIDDALPGSKIIFAGHRGCGKSTLLARLSRQMQDQGYFLVFFSISDMVEMSAVDHVNILYTIAVQLLSKATQNRVSIPPETQSAILDWFKTTYSTTSSRAMQSELAAGTDLLNVITAKLKSESTFREEIKRTFERSINDLVKQIDRITHAIEQATKRQVLVIIDDLDKLDWKLVVEIYKNNINALFQPNLRVVLTIPIAVIRDIELRTILQAASGSPIQQMEVTKFYSKIDRHNPKAAPEEKKLKLFLNILEKRFPPELIEPETARQIILMSGGVVREVVRIARACCSECLLRLRQEPETTVKINPEILQQALRNIRNDFAASLGENRYNLLAMTYHQAEPVEITDPEFLVLLHGLYVLEYRNNDLWYDVHPVVQDLLRRRNLLSDPEG